MFNFFKNHETHIGLDVSDVSLKAVQLDFVNGKKVVRAFSNADIPKGTVDGDFFKDPQKLSDAIKRAIRNPHFGKFTTPYVAASVPEAKSFVRVIEIPKMTEEEAVEAIPWEAETYIPLPISQVYLDWLIIGEPAKKSTKPKVAEGDPTMNAPALSEGNNGESPAGEKMTVLIAACPRDYIDRYLEVIKDAGLIPVALEVESQAAARSLVGKDEMKEAVLIIDIDTVRSSMVVYDQGLIHFTSSLPIAGNIFTEKIAQALTISTEEAEKLKKKYGLDEEAENGQIKKAMRPVLNNLVEEIRNTIKFHEEHAGVNSKVSRILLTGGSSKMKHLPSYIMEQIEKIEKTSDHNLRSVPGVQVELGNPWVNIFTTKEVPPMSRIDSLSYATALGLALRKAE